MAYSDLQQIGLEAKYVRFQSIWASKPANLSKIKEEKRKLELQDVENQKKRSVDVVSLEDQWKAELQEAFMWTSRLYTPISTLELLGNGIFYFNRNDRVSFRQF